MIEVNRVGGDYVEFWLEEGERELVKRLFKIKWDSVIVIVTIVRKGLDSEDLRCKTHSPPEPTDDDTADLFARCDDPDHQ